MVLRQRSSAFEPDKAQQVVGQVGQPELVLRLGSPTVRTTRRRRCFWQAKTCSTAARTGR